MNSSSRIQVTVFTDPGCPWGYSALPALRVLEWRYGTQLEWRVVMIGLAEDASQYVARGYTPAMAASNVMFRDRWGMPFVVAPKARMSATSQACRLVVAAGIDHPGSEHAVLRELQFAQFTNASVLMDDVPSFVDALVAAGRLDLDVPTFAARIDDEDVRTEYERQRAESRTAAGGAGALQGKTANTDGAERYTAPSVLFDAPGGRHLEASGFQPVEAYDVLVANLDPALERRAPAADVAEVLAAFPHGSTTAEIAAIMTSGNDAIDIAAAERDLVRLVADGAARRIALGSDALWLPA